MRCKYIFFTNCFESSPLIIISPLKQKVDEAYINQELATHGGYV
jgi:hypothetical protein